MKTVVHIKIDGPLNEEKRQVIINSLKPHFDMTKVLVLVTDKAISVSVYPYLIHWIKALPIRIKLRAILKWNEFVQWWKQDYRIIEWSAHHFEIEYRIFGMWYVLSVPNGSMDGLTWEEPLKFQTKREAQFHIDEYLRKKKKKICDE